jgi:hypothetical protein
MRHPGFLAGRILLFRMSLVSTRRRTLLAMR